MSGFCADFFLYYIDVLYTKSPDLKRSRPKSGESFVFYASIAQPSTMPKKAGISKCIGTFLVCTHSENIVYAVYKYLSVADIACIENFTGGIEDKAERYF